MKKKVKNTILKLIPIRRYDWNNNCYVYANGTVMDLVCIKCKDFNAQSEGDIERDILALTSFFRLYKDEIKIISINIPTSCEEQMHFIGHKIAGCKNEYRKKELEIKNSEMEWIQKNRLNKEFYIMYFSRDIEEHKKHRLQIEENLRNNNLLVDITKRHKDIVLMKMANKNIKS